MRGDVLTTEQVIFVIAMIASFMLTVNFMYRYTFMGKFVSSMTVLLSSEVRTSTNGLNVVKEIQN